jgi:hypothetical protein
MDPSNLGARSDLGGAYLSLGQIDKGLVLLKKLAQDDRVTPATLNSVAYQLALRKVELDLAKQYAESAVKRAVIGLPMKGDEPITVNILRREVTLAEFWDTLGWVHFQRSELDEADKFVTGLVGRPEDHGWRSLGSDL